jgi:hypothetical protein
MNILVRTPLKVENIKQLLDGNSYDGYTFSFVKKTGIDMEFETTGESSKDPVDVVKSVIRGTDYGSALYFSVIKK